MDIPLWVILGILGTITLAGLDLYKKHLVDDDHSPLNVTLQMHIVGLVPALAILVYFPLTISRDLAILIIGTGVVNGFGFWFLARAFHRDAISLVAPLRGLIPISVALVEPLVFPDFHYHPPLLISALIVSIGMYILLYEDSLQTTRQRLRDPGVMYGVGFALCITAAVLIDRYALVTTGVHPITYSSYLLISTLFVTFGITLYYADRPLNSIRPTRIFVPLGILRFGNILIAMAALSLIDATRINVLWQFGVVITALLGGKLFREDHLLRRVIGAVLIALAAALVIVI